MGSNAYLPYPTPSYLIRAKPVHAIVPDLLRAHTALHRLV
jgi:hypothetical protein